MLTTKPPSGKKKHAPAVGATATELQWDDLHLKALLQLPRFPARLIQTEPWYTWLAQRGGAAKVREYLRSAPLEPRQRQFLETLLTEPDTPALLQAQKLSLAQSTYFKYLQELLQPLRLHLNAWRLPTAIAEPEMHITAPPTPWNSLVGAEPALQSLLTLLRDPETRLVTLIGPGGIGKTRLALEAAGRLHTEKVFRNGVVWVELAQIDQATLVLPHILKVLGMPTSGQPTSDVLKFGLQTQQTLLICDNFEQVVDAGPLLTELLSVAPGVKICVTSREALHLYGEHKFMVPLLALPDPHRLPPVPQLAEYPAVQLFLKRAQAVAPHFALTTDNAPAVAEICLRLDGLPLALELAAAHVRVLTPQTMLSALANRMELLTGGPRDRPSRHQTLRQLLDWSYNRLTLPEQALFRRLSVFTGGWTVTAIKTVCSGEPVPIDILTTLTMLLDKSLVHHPIDIQTETRLEFLETIREYAAEKLAINGETLAMQQRHAAYYVALAEDAEMELIGPDQMRWLELLEREHANLRTALAWACTNAKAETALRICGALWRFWNVRGHSVEARRWIDRALALETTAPGLARFKTLLGAGWLAWNQGQRDYTHAHTCFSEALVLAQASGDKRSMGLVLQGLGEIVQSQGNRAEAQQLFESALAALQDVGDIGETAWCLDHLARLALARHDFADAQPLAAESLRLFRQSGYQFGIAMALSKTGSAWFGLKNHANAKALFNESCQIFKKLGNRWSAALAMIYEGLSDLELDQPDVAHATLIESLQIFYELHDVSGISFALLGLACVASARANHTRAAQLCGASLALKRSGGSYRIQSDKIYYAKSLVTALSHLDDASFQMAWDTGQTMDIELLVKYARQEPTLSER